MKHISRERFLIIPTAIKSVVSDFRTSKCQSRRMHSIRSHNGQYHPWKKCEILHLAARHEKRIHLISFRPFEFNIVDHTHRVLIGYIKAVWKSNCNAYIERVNLHTHVHGCVNPYTPTHHYDTLEMGLSVRKCTDTKVICVRLKRYFDFRFM